MYNDNNRVLIFELLAFLPLANCEFIMYWFFQFLSTPWGLASVAAFLAISLAESHKDGLWCGDCSNKSTSPSIGRPLARRSLIGETCRRQIRKWRRTLSLAEQAKAPEAGPQLLQCISFEWPVLDQCPGHSSSVPPPPVPDRPAANPQDTSRRRLVSSWRRGVETGSTGAP